MQETKSAAPRVVFFLVRVARAAEFHTDQTGFKGSAGTAYAVVNIANFLLGMLHWCRDGPARDEQRGLEFEITSRLLEKAILWASSKE